MSNQMKSKLVEVMDKNKRMFYKYKGKCLVCKMETLVCDGYLNYHKKYNNCFNASNWGPLCRTCRAYRFEQGDDLNDADEKLHILKRDIKSVEKVNTHIVKPTPKQTEKQALKPKPKANKYIQDLFIDEE
jgi:hypothetical protein